MKCNTLLAVGVIRTGLVWAFNFMHIKYQFDLEKALSAIMYILHKLGGSTDKAKLMKLLYYSDRNHFLKTGAPITGDRQVAMPYGPVPSSTLNLLNGDLTDAIDIDQHIELLGRKTVQERQALPKYHLDAAELDTINAVLDEHGNKHTSRLINETHRLPEYCQVYEQDSWTSELIPYELMLTTYCADDESKCRSGKAVVSSEMREQQICPFYGSETDL
jgi:uncharacterized phage-associated protein